MARDKLRNGKIVKLTAEEEAQRDKDDVEARKKRRRLEDTAHHRARQPDYLDIGDQLDLFIKGIQRMMASGQEVPMEWQVLANHSAGVKAKHPKPKKRKVHVASLARKPKNEIEKRNFKII